MIADEGNECALAPAHVGKRIRLSVHAAEREVARLPAEFANTGLGEYHHNLHHSCTYVGMTAVPGKRRIAPPRSERMLFPGGAFMSWSINIGTIARTPVRIHITFVLFLGWIFFPTYAAAGPDAAFPSPAFSVLPFA